MLVPVTSTEARAFVRKWHYTGTASAGVLRYGWVHDDRLVGVSIFDTGIHAMRKGVFGPAHYQHVLHHHRLAMTDDAPCFESQFIGACLRDMRANCPSVWAVVTYADTCQGHDGTIYQATNALYTGLFARGNLKFRRPDGSIASTQALAKVGTWPERRAEAARRGWQEIRCGGKHRYVYLLGTKRQRKTRPPMLWPSYEYPKKGNSMAEENLGEVAQSGLAAVPDEDFEEGQGQLDGMNYTKVKFNGVQYDAIDADPQLGDELNVRVQGRVTYVGDRIMKDGSRRHEVGVEVRTVLLDE